MEGLGEGGARWAARSALYRLVVDERPAAVAVVGGGGGGGASSRPLRREYLSGSFSPSSGSDDDDDGDGDGFSDESRPSLVGGARRSPGRSCRPWPSPADGRGFSEGELVGAFRSQLTSEAHRRAFRGMDYEEETQETAVRRGNAGEGGGCGDGGVDIVDVVPTGGTLVLFDSVAVPHTVTPMAAAVDDDDRNDSDHYNDDDPTQLRVAMAGWFHVKQQPFPDWFGF